MARYRAATNPLEEKLFFNSLLRLAKDEMGLTRLSHELGIDIPTLSKYSTGRLYPSLKRIRELTPRLERLVDPLNTLEAALRNGVMEGPELNNVLVARPYLAVWAALSLKKRLGDTHYNKVVTVEGGGITIASIMSMLDGKRMAYALRNTYVPQGITEPCMPLARERGDPKLRTYITLPQKAIQRGDRVLVVDDVSWTGCTITTLRRLSEFLGASVTSVAVVALTRDALELASRELSDVKYLMLL